MGAPLSDKMYYKIGEVAQMAGVRPSVLRFWESEFDFLKPDKSSTGQRLYARREVELILAVRQMLYGEKLTLAGVRQRISPRGKLRAGDQPEQQPDCPGDDHLKLLREIRDDLRQLRELL